MTCHHDACTCTVPFGLERYCGSHCHNAVARDAEESDCQCGHAECEEAHDVVEPTSPRPYAAT